MKYLFCLIALVGSFSLYNTIYKSVPISVKNVSYLEQSYVDEPLKVFINLSDEKGHISNDVNMKHISFKSNFNSDIVYSECKLVNGIIECILIGNNNCLAFGNDEQALESYIEVVFNESLSHIKPYILDIELHKSKTLSFNKSFLSINGVEAVKMSQIGSEAYIESHPYSIIMTFKDDCEFNIDPKMSELSVNNEVLGFSKIVEGVYEYTIINQNKEYDIVYGKNHHLKLFVQ